MNPGCFFQPLIAQNKSASSVFFNQRMHNLFVGFCYKTCFSTRFCGNPKYFGRLARGAFVGLRTTRIPDGPVQKI